MHPFGLVQKCLAGKLCRSVILEEKGEEGRNKGERKESQKRVARVC